MVNREMEEAIRTNETAGRIYCCNETERRHVAGCETCTTESKRHVREQHTWEHHLFPSSSTATELFIGCGHVGSASHAGEGREGMCMSCDDDHHWQLQLHSPCPLLGSCS